MPQKIHFCFRDLKPPASTKTSVYKWNQQISDISKEIGKSVAFQELKNKPDVLYTAFCSIQLLMYKNNFVISSTYNKTSFVTTPQWSSMFGNSVPVDHYAGSL